MKQLKFKETIFLYYSLRPVKILKFKEVLLRFRLHVFLSRFTLTLVPASSTDCITKNIISIRFP